MNSESKKILPFSKDTTVIILAGINVLGALFAALLVLIRLRSHAFKVPVQHIVNEGGEVSLASWYTLYSLGFFVIFGAIIAIWLARRLHAHNPVFAHGVLAGQTVVLAVSLLTINALLGLVSRL